jgi:hypothetical protein
MTSLNSSLRFHSLKTHQVAIGQRCILLETPAGNVLWDCITYLDDETIEYVQHKLQAMCDWGTLLAHIDQVKRRTESYCRMSTHCQRPAPMNMLMIFPISHPHYYTTHIEWAKAFECPVYVASDDQ